MGVSLTVTGNTGSSIVNVSVFGTSSEIIVTPAFSCVGSSVTSGVTVGVTSSVTSGVTSTVTSGVTVGVTSSVTSGVTVGVTSSVTSGVIVGTTSLADTVGTAVNEVSPSSLLTSVPVTISLMEPLFIAVNMPFSRVTAGSGCSSNA